MSRLIAIALVSLLAACAHAPATPPALPQPRLAPAALALDVSLSQRLRFVHERAGVDETLDAQLEIDADALRLAAFALGQRMLSLHWDGERLDAHRGLQLPEAVDAERILRDIEYAYAPTEALQAVLPKGWSVRDRGARRELSHGRSSAIVIDYATMPRWHGAVVLDNRYEGYRLDIETVVDRGELRR